MLSATHRSWRFLIAFLVLVGVVSAAYAEGTVTDVKVVGGSNTVRIEVSASGPVQHRAKALTQPQNQIIVDVFPAKLGGSVKGDMPINKGLVSSASVKQLTDNTVRITVNTISLPDYKVVTANESKGLTLSVSTVTMAEGKVSNAPAEPVQTDKPEHKSSVTKAPAKNGTHASVKPVEVAQAPAHHVSGLQALHGAGQETSALRRRPAPRRHAPTKLVTLDFVNADLVYVIKILAKEMGRNVYIGPGVEGSVTVTLKSVPVDGALALILKMQENDIGYKLINYNTLIVAAPEKINQIEEDILGKNFAPKRMVDGVRQEIILEKAPAAKVISFLQGQYKNVEFIPHPTMNGFYVRGSKADVLSIRSEVPNLDKVPDPVAPPQREFIKIKYADLNEAKSLLATLVPDVQMNVDSRQTTLILEGAPGAIEQAKELLDNIDRPLDQVMIEAKVVDLSESGRKAIGMTWGSTTAPGVSNVTFEEAYRSTLAVPVGSPAGTVPTATGPFALVGNALTGIGPFQGFQNLSAATTAFPIPIGTFARSGLALATNINYLVTTNEAKVLASPRVASQSGTEAQIHIGDKYPIVYFDPRAGQFQVNYVDIGIKLNVTATVKGDGYVVCKILPEVSTLVELVNNQYPRTAVRKVSTDARIKDGETLVLGGLITEQDVQAVTKVPLLGDLPLLGALFRNTSVTKSRNEVVIMLTPQIMK